MQVSTPCRRRFLQPAVSLALVLLVTLTFRLPFAGASAPGAWTEPVGNTGPRYGHVAVRLPDGRVLVAGGLLADKSVAFIGGWNGKDLIGDVGLYRGN